METFYRTAVESEDLGVELSFQALEWNTSDFETDGNEMKYTINCFGVDNLGRSVCCKINEYEPHFYILKENMTKAVLLEYLQKLKNKQIEGKKYVNYYTEKGFCKKNVTVETFKNFYGFTNNTDYQFFKLSFTSERSMLGYKYAIQKENILQTFEVNIDTLLKFFHDREIQPSNWVNVVNFYTLESDELSSCQINIECNFNDITPTPVEFNANILQASFDIETYSSPEINSDGKQVYPFPIPEKSSNAIYQIGTCFKRLNDPDFHLKTVFTLKKSSVVKSKNCFVIECESEKDLICKWIMLIRQMDPDILYTYNGDIFDCNYINVRCEMLRLTTQLGSISRLYDIPAQVKQEKFSSSAYGTSNYTRLKIPGRINFDIIIFIRREYIENSYKLDSIASKYLGLKKNDVSPQDIFKAYEDGSPDDILRIAEYCIQDTVLPQKLVDVLHILQSQISMSNVTCVPIRFLIEKGQQVKALSQISANTKKKGYLLPYFKYKPNDGESFTGATVLDAKAGFYDTPVTVLDFASLYPSIIRAHNLCYTTIVLDYAFREIPGVEYLTVCVDGKDFLYAQGVNSILPELLADLAVQRKKYKKLMASSSDPTTKEIYNKTQLAYKVSMNSVYGILGSNSIGCKPIAATVTKIGREMIQKTKEYIETTDHNVYPLGYDTCDLADTDIIQVKTQENLEKSIMVSELPYQSGWSILTTKGYRQILF